MAPIRVKVRMMGPLKEASGSEERTLTLNQGAKVSDAIHGILEPGSTYIKLRQSSIDRLDPDIPCMHEVRQARLRLLQAIQR